MYYTINVSTCRFLPLHYHICIHTHTHPDATYLSEGLHELDGVVEAAGGVLQELVDGVLKGHLVGPGSARGVHLILPGQDGTQRPRQVHLDVLDVPVHPGPVLEPDTYRGEEGQGNLDRCPHTERSKCAKWGAQWWGGEAQARSHGGGGEGAEPPWKNLSPPLGCPP